jgi:hypothetical protein
MRHLRLRPSPGFASSPGTLLAMAFFACAAASAQTKAPQQVVKPPVAQLWVDVTTSTMPGMPDMSGMPGMGALGGMLGMPGGAGNNSFGNTRGMSPGRWVDIALVTQRKPAGTDGTQTVPAASSLAPSVPLVPVRVERSTPRGETTEREPQEFEQPKGRILFYWGCSETVKPGQPRVLDFSKAGPQEWGNFMQGRAPRERGAVARPGHAIWPNDKDRRTPARDASLVGEHEVTGDGVPAGMKFAIAQSHDFMPAIALSQSGATNDVLRLSWQPIAQARGYFLNAMSGGQGADGTTEMVFWSSAEVPDFGMGLIDFASPANVDQWTKERVLLTPSVTQCAIPQGIFAKAGGGMLRMIAYGPELNLAHPPRPADVKVPWEPEWAVRVRTKSTAMAMLGQSTEARASSRASRGAAAPAATAPSAGREARPDCPPASSSADAASAVGGALGGSVGRAVGGFLGGLGGAKKEEKKDAAADCPR